MLHPTRRSFLASLAVLRARGPGAISRKRLSVAPEVPTLTELLGQDFDTVTWNGLWAPTGTSQDIVTRLHEAISVGRRNPALVRQYEDQGTPLMPDMSLQQVNAFMAQETGRWKALVKEAQVTL